MESAVALDVLERAQAEPDQPPAAGQRQDQRAGRHRELGQEQRVQRAGLVDERLRLHETRSPSAPSPPAPGRRGRRARWTSREVGHLRPVGLGA